MLNEAFIAVKVDREERPDLDGIYMTVCQAMTGSGDGLYIIMTHEQKPFLPEPIFRKKQFRADRPVGAGEEDSSAVADPAGRIARRRRSHIWLNWKRRKKTAGVQLQPDILDRAFFEMAQAYDERYGGFGFAPKFPTPPPPPFLLRYWQRTGEEEALSMVEHTLTVMRKGDLRSTWFGFFTVTPPMNGGLPSF